MDTTIQITDVIDLFKTNHLSSKLHSERITSLGVILRNLDGTDRLDLSLWLIVAAAPVIDLPAGTVAAAARLE